MKMLSTPVIAAAIFLSAGSLQAYERLQGPTEVLYWNKTNAYAGYTFFGVRSNTYLINMEGRVVHTWPLGTNPHLLTNGNVLDATSGDVSGFTTLREVDWNGSIVWQYTEARTNYAPHHDFTRIYNPKLGTNTTFYIAAKTISSNACVAAGCNPANGPYTNAQVDAIVEVDMAGNVVWEWCFFDHGIQDFDASKSNYVGAGKSISNYVGRLNLNLPGRSVTNDWLHCNSIDYNQTLDQIVINAAGGEFYVIDHGNTFIAGNPASSIALAASTNGDFLYRFGDPARYSQGNPPSIQQNWTTSTTGNKQIGASSHAQWIAEGLPGAGQFLVYNNGGDLFETTPQSYAFQINGYLNASTNDTGAYVNPPTAGYNNWAAPGHDTDKRTKSMSRQITWMYYSMANQGMFSHLDSSVQRLLNGNTLICDSTEGHIFEVTATGDAVWEYINPVSSDGIMTYKRDNWPMYNGLFRAYRFATNYPAFTGRTLTPLSTITGKSPSYISAPSISGTTMSPAIPTAASSVWVTSLITNGRSVASATLTYIVGTSTNSVTMLDDSAHQDGAAGDGIYGGEIPVLPAATLVRYFVSAQDDFGNSASDPAQSPGTTYSYTVQNGGSNLPPAIATVTNTLATAANPVWVTCLATDDVSVASVSLSYSTGVASSTTNLVFLETMTTNAAKPWTGMGADNLWTVTYAGTKNPFEQGTNANFGGGNTNGLIFKNSSATTNLADNAITTANEIDARGSSGSVEFLLRALWQTNTESWAFQLNTGSGFITRTGEVITASHATQLYHYDLQPSELVSNLTMRFQFQSDAAATNNRVFLDYISVQVVGDSGASWTNVAMLDDGAHLDGSAADKIYGGQIPAFPAGTTVSYYLMAADGAGLLVTNPASGAGVPYSYTVNSSAPDTNTCNVLLGRPTDHSIAVSILSSNDLEVCVAYGTLSGLYGSQTATNTVVAGVPTVITLDSLSSGQNYYYRVYTRQPGGGSFSAGAEHSFHTQRATGDTFTFIIEADPHYLDNEPPVWQRALTNMLADEADFLIDLGDVFMGEKYYKTNSYTLSQPGINEACRTVRDQFFSISGHSLPLFLVNGNHDPELGWLLNNSSPTNNSAVWADHARELYYPCPIPGSFYSGSTNADSYLGGGTRDGYYAFEWGNALFVMLDNFWYSWQGTNKSTDPWDWTLGDNQYQWLKRTLETSQAKFKFVFAHHLVGGAFDAATQMEARGGLTWAPYFEWGGYNTNGTWGFDTHRPGWAMPIQSLLLSNKVNAFFHGHDHLFVKEDLDSNGDGITDLVYQECPQPSRTNYNSTGAAAGYGYTNGVLQGNSGYLRVQVSPTNATVDYVRVYLPADEGSGRTNRMVTYSYSINAPTSSVPVAAFAGSIVLGRPTDHSITVSLVSSNDLQMYLEYGLSSGAYSHQTAVTNISAGVPLEVLLNGLAGNSRYYYRLRYKSAADTNYLADVEHSFVTQRPPGSTFTFSIQGDSHPERVNTMFNSALYTRTLLTATADQPDFYLTIGDDFSVDLIPTNLISPALVTARYTLQRPYLGLIGNSAPLFLVNGNHEQAARYLLDGTSNNIAVWAQNARNTYYPEPAPDAFYTGNPEVVPFIGLLRNFYAWTWGDALFVTIDPYWGSPTCVDDNYWTGVKRTNLWDVTHADLQYEWLKQTLEQSTAKYKFVFAHHVLGTGRGGVDEAPLYEWGGENGNGTWGFAANRPGWPAPLHQLMAANNVAAFIQGHDHIWVQQQLDGVTYQTLPNPADPNYATNNADAFLTGVKLPNTGYTRFTVTPAGVKVEYVRTYLPADEGSGRTNGAVAYSYVILPLTISGITNSTALAGQPVWVTSTISAATNISQALLTYMVGGVTNTTPMLDDSLHQDGMAGDGVFGAQIPAFAAGTTIQYFVHAQDAASRQVTAPSGAPMNTNLISYTVVAAVSNTAPVLDPQIDRTVNPGYTLLVTNTAHDADLPAQALTFSLLNPPANASINATSGIVSFSPTLAQLGTTNLINVVAADSGTPAMRATNAFRAIVLANTAPVLAPVSDRMIEPGSVLLVTNSASDAEAPPQILTFELADGPVGAAINPTNGLITWSSSEADAGTTNEFLVVVTDNGIPSLLDWQWFTVLVDRTSSSTNTAWTMLKLPDTGQTQSYTATFGEDSDYTINPPSFTDNGDGTVTDNVTGLTWQKADGGEMTWSNAVLYAQTNRIGGQSDWRLPTSHEAFSILNHGIVNPALDTNVFTLSTAQYWWTADTQITDATRIWAINAGGGIGAHRQDETLSAGGTFRYHVRCVRSGTGIAWTPIVGPYSSAGGYLEYLDTSVSLQPTKFYRLRYTGSNGVPPSPPPLSIRKESAGVVLYWPTDVTGFTLEYAAELAPTSATTSTPSPAHHITDNGNGTITDQNTGLVWQQAEASAMNWESALQYAEGLALAGQTDWRLPNIKELQSINDETRANPSVDTNFFVGANASRHWCSTTVMNLTNRAWYVDFQLGLVSYDDKLTNLFVRCVRGGLTNATSSTNTFTAQFVKIAAGSYQMGDHFGFVDPAHPSDEVPVHNVSVDSFYMETTLLTCTEYVQFLNSALAQGLVEVRSNYVYGVGGTNICCDTYGSDTNSRVQWSGSAFSVRDGRELHPITGIRWFGAIAYCNWASARDGFTACYNLATGDCNLTNNGYRLPTEAEWEYAARGGLYNPYGMFPWGSDTNADGTLANWAGKTNPFATSAYPWTTPVGFYNGSLQSKTNFNWPAADATYQTRNNMNGFGLYDMSGNVWEWINDWYASDYYTNCVLNNIVTNPPGPVTGSLMPDGMPYRGLRGGNWFNGQDQYGHARVANRNPSYFRGPGDPNGPWFHIGFRVMRRGYTSVVAAGATLTNLASGLHFTEGPAADAAGNVFFSDIPADTIYKWSVSNQLSIFRTNSGGANGLSFDAAGNLLACEGDNGRLVSITSQGSATVVVSNYAGLRFNEPNDLWIDPAGGVYFTDPTYFGHAVVQGGEYVYYLKPDRSAVLRVVADTVRPNGLVGTPDGKTLYLADWGATNVFRYSVNADGTLTNKTSFARVKCDGMTLDAEGNLYFCENAVLVYDSAGNQVEQISVPERPTNLEFGGSDRKTLFITTDAGSLYSMRLRVAGATNAVVTNNQPPVIANVAISPATPTTNDTVWLTALVTDDMNVSNVMLTYSTGSGGGSSQTNTVFLETMATNAVKPWTGTGCNNAWTVTGSVFEQRSGANSGAGNTNGMEFKGGTTNLTDSMIATTSSIDARGNSGFVEFWMQTLTISNQYGNAGWTFQFDSGSGYVTRLSELTSTSHGWQQYHYDLQAAELVSSLKMRFQFRGGSAESRMDLDQISVKVASGGSSSTNVAMLDDGLHLDGAVGDHVYGAFIPASPLGTTVNYFLTATDSGGLTTKYPTNAPATMLAYTVQAGSSTNTNTLQTVGLFLNTTNAFPGYTLMAPMHHTNTYLINNAGEVVHAWTSAYEPGRSAYLMTNGHMFRAGMVKQGGPSTGGGEGGRIEEFDWDGNLVWAIDYYSPTYIHHHDFKVLPNGNVLMLVAEKKTLAEVIAAGFNTNLLDASIFTQGYMLPDCLVEVTPTHPYGGTVVWEWHLWDHMIQDYDPTKNNYGVVADHPELIDVNGPGIKIPQFWNHVNGIDHNAQLDQVMLSIRGNSELFVIDHQTTTAQAAGHTGGRYTKGGDILYRWGNPQQYNRGTSANQQLFQQHHTHWIETNCPGAGNILIFNNGIGRGYSAVNEIVPPVDAAGNYTLASGAAFGPISPVWSYTATPPTNFYSAEISGAQRLPNGNTLICEGIKGNLFEVTAAGQTVWSYLCPVTTTIMTQSDSIPVDPARTDQFMNAVFRVDRYPTNYAGLLGRDLTPQGTIEIPVNQILSLVSSQMTPSGVQFGWSSLPSQNYAVLYKATLATPVWTSIATNRSIGTLTFFTDTNAIRLSQPQGFYRVTQLP